MRRRRAEIGCLGFGGSSRVSTWSGRLGAGIHVFVDSKDKGRSAARFDEVRRLRSDPRLHPDLPAIRAVGYRQAWAFLDGGTDAAGFREQAIAATRQLAKRQLTWLRGEHDARWLDPATEGAELDAALRLFVTRR